MKTLPALTEGTPKLKTRSSQPRIRKTKTSAIPTNDTKIRTVYKTRDTVKLRPFRWLSFRHPKTRDLHATSTFRSMPELRSALYIQHSWLARDQTNTRHLFLVRSGVVSEQINIFLSVGLVVHDPRTHEFKVTFQKFQY